MRKNEIQRLTTVTEVIAAFGGASKLAAWAGHGQPMVSNWEARGYIPPGWHLKLSYWAEENGYALSPRVFGEDDTPRPRSRATAPAHA